MSNILILTSVVGGGHVFRDVAIAGELKKTLPSEYEFVFASGGNAFQMLKNEGLRVEKLEGISYPVNLGTINFFKFYFILLWSEFIQMFQLRKLIKKHNPKLIILDEFFFLTDYCKLWNIPVVFMCDFIGVPKSPFFSNPLRSSLETFFDWLAISHLPKRADKWIYIGDPDHIPCENWRSRIYHENIVPVEPITKLQYVKAPSKNAARRELCFENDETVVTVTVGCSGTGGYLLEAVNYAALPLKKKIEKLRIELICGYGIDPANLQFTPEKGVTVHGYVMNIETFYASSDVVVIQSGITTATECLMIGTPMVAVPITDHWEQEHTAQYLAKKAGTLIIKGKDVSSDVMADAILKTLSKDPNTKRSWFKGNGHQLAAKTIADVVAQNTK